MEKGHKYRIAWGFNLANLVITAVFIVLFIIAIIIKVESRVDVFVLISVIPIAMSTLVVPIITHVVLSKDIKLNQENSHIALGICNIIFAFAFVFGLVAGILILVFESHGPTQIKNDLVITEVKSEVTNEITTEK